MVFVKINEITILKEQNFLEKERDFIAELVSEEARSVVAHLSFILHEIVESKRYCKIFVEGSAGACKNLHMVLKSNLSSKFKIITVGL